MTTNNQPLAKPLRTQLENTVKAAREAAEKGARAALSQLAVGEAKAPDYLTDELKALRRRLRAHGRALGDNKAADDTQGLQHLVWEVAYEHWHRMLFARFLAENGLLLWEPGAAVSLDDCEALVQESDPTINLGAKTKWELAGKLAAPPTVQAQIHDELGLSQRRLGDLKGAEASFRAALKLGPTMHGVRLHLCTTLAAAGRCPEALRESESLPTTAPFAGVLPKRSVLASVET